MLKIDLSDGFYRIPVRADDITKLGVVFPTAPGEPPLVAFPLVLPMGWTESPPTFCAATETIVDLANQYMEHWDPPQHPLEAAASTPPERLDDRPMFTVPAPIPSPPGPDCSRPTALPPLPRRRRRRQRRRPLAYADVFVDDEIQLAQGSPARLNRLRRVLLHVNDLVFRPNDELDAPDTRKEPVSVKKLRNGDASWATCKVVLGWMIDTIRGTIELPPHRRSRLLEILSRVRGRKRCSVREGELRSMALAIPGGRGLFSQLQFALKVPNRRQNRVRIHQAAQDHLEDFWTLAQDLTNRPTRIAEIVPDDDFWVLGACDAAKSGMGGVWFPPDASSPPGAPTHPPIAWHFPFPQNIQDQVVSFDNPTGSITNSDLELAGTIAHQDVIVRQVDCRERTVATGCDNTPSVAWRDKGSTTTDGPAAYLLWEASLHQRHHRFKQRHFHLAGYLNVLADVASRRFDMSDSQFLAYLDLVAPQTQPWQLHQLPSDMSSKLLNALQRQRRTGPLIPTATVPSTRSGESPGSPFVDTFESTNLCLMASRKMNASDCSECLASLSGLANSVEVANRSVLTTFATKSFKSQRRSPTWAG
jgi:hypothetical protein